MENTLTLDIVAQCIRNNQKVTHKRLWSKIWCPEVNEVKMCVHCDYAKFP